MLNIAVTMNSAAFEDERAIEAARILRELADTIEGLVRHTAQGTYSGGIRDINGVTVGLWSITPTITEAP